MNESPSQEALGRNTSSGGPGAVRTLLALGAIVGLILLNWWVFRLWDASYFVWYLKNGALISIVLGFAVLAGADLDRALGLISVNPACYLEACLSLPSWPFLAVSASIDAGRQGRSMGNALLLFLLSVCLFIGVLIFLLVAVPLQYFVYLVCGAAGRAISSAKSSVSYWMASGDYIGTRVWKSPRGELPKQLAEQRELTETRSQIQKLEDLYKSSNDPAARADLAELRIQVDRLLESIHVKELTFTDQPVKLTAAFASLVLWVVGQFVR